MKNSLLVFLFLLLSLGGYSQTCTLSVNLSSTGTAVCSGSVVVLTATPSAGTAPYSFVWNTGETTSSITVNKAGTYTVTVTDKTPGCQPVKQSITITSAIIPDAPTAAGAIVCQNSPATLTATAPGGSYQWYDAPTGGNFLGSGAVFTTKPITSATTFYLQTTIAGCTSTRSPINVTILGKPTVTGASVCQGDVATLSASGADSYIWYDAPSGGNVVSTASTYTTPPLAATTTYYVVATTSGCTSAATPVVAKVNPPPQAPTVSNITICSGSVASLHANAPAGVFDWFTVPTGGTSLISSPDYTTPPLTTTTTYYVQTSLNTCVSARTAVTVTVNPVPVAPVIANTSVCLGSSAALTPTIVPGMTYQWYDFANGGTLLATGNTFNTPAITNTTTYYVLATNGGCISARVPVTVTVNTPPVAPSAASPIICSGNVAVLTAFAPGGTYQWYDAATGGNLLITNATFTTPVLTATTTYYVQTTVGGCTSPRSAVTVTVLPIPAAPTASGTTVCAGSSATLTASGATGSYDWYDAATGGNYLSSGQVFVTPALSTTTTFYVQNTTSGCPSTRTPVVVTVNPTPATPTASGTTVCPGSSANLTASVPGGTIQWYDAATAGNLVATGTSFSTPSLFNTTTYYLENTIGSCVSPRAPVTVNVTSVPSPQFQYATGTFCTSGSNPTPVINNPAGGTFSASPAGLVFVSNTTGQINLATSAPGNYTIFFLSNGTCPNTTVFKVSIVTIPDAHFSYSGPYCKDQAITPIPVFPAGSSGGVFTSSPAGLVFANATSGAISLSGSNAGTYTITNTIAANGGCPGSVFTATVTINAAVIISAGPDQNISSGTVQLAGSIFFAPGGKWSGGTGTFSDPNLLNAVYTPGPGETVATLTLTSNAPPSPCGPKTDQMTVHINLIPGAPTASGATICSGSTATLSATAPGGAYRWFDAASGGTQLATGPSFTTPPLIANVTYYVQTTVGGITSARTPVTVTVNPIPVTPVAPGVTICAGSPANLSASGSTGTYQWYDAPIGGTLLSTSATYVTPALTTNTSYYVQSVSNGCSSPVVKVDVVVNPVPAITSSAIDNVCSGTALNYTITSDVPAASFTWSRAVVAGISNPAVTNQSSANIAETLINTGGTPVNVIYVIVPMSNGCTGTPFNYIVTVNPSPVVTSDAAATICNGTTDNYTVAFNAPATTFTWSRAAVPGVSNLAVSGQTAGTIREVLFNTTNAPVDVNYTFSYRAGLCVGSPFNLVITVNPAVRVTGPSTGTICSASAQNYTIVANIASATFTWSRAAVAGISNPAVADHPAGIIDETLISTSKIPVKVIYIITPSANGCPGIAFTYTVTVNPQPAVPVANANSPICIGSTIQLRTPTISKATYQWTGPNGYSTTTQNPNIVGVTAANAGEYDLYITLNGCTSPPAPVTVVIDEPPVANAGPDQVVCNNATTVQLAGTMAGGTTTGVWTSAGTGTFSPSPNNLNAQYLPTAADRAAGSVKLTLTSTSKDDCTISASSMTVTFQTPTVSGPATGVVCTGTAQNYTISSAMAGVTFTWRRAAVAGISNAAVTGQTTAAIDETLINTTTAAINVNYIIVPDLNGCPGTPFTYVVTVNPQPVKPVVTVNSPVCVASTIHLQTPGTPNATYAWTGPNGYTSVSQNPDIPNVSVANSGTYSLIISVNGCPGPVASVNVVVDEPPVAVAGPDQTTCATTTSIALTGSITGGTTTGIWTTSGTGTFSPSATQLNAKYIPSAADKTAGSVILTLSSTSNDDCTIATSSLTLRFQPAPGADAGPDQEVCSQDVAVPLAGKILVSGGGSWTTSGTGTFSPADAPVNSLYIPSAADIQSGSVTLTLHAAAAGLCNIATDDVLIRFIPPPTLNAGGTRYVLHGRTIVLTPTVSDENVQYLWTPNTNMDDNTLKNPTITGVNDITYTLTVTDSRGCVSTDQTIIKVSPEIVIPNTFTPNGDGINDLWNIEGLIAYQQSTIDIFDRYGQKVFHSVGYGKAWDGTFAGKQVPNGVYYYVIDTKFTGQPLLSGSITVLR